jgi:colicin import membrane protein
VNAALAAYEEPGGAAPAALSVLVHLLLFAFLYFGVQWQTKHPDTVEVELWSQLPAAEPQPAPPVEPRPEPKPELKPAPPPPPAQKVEAAPKKPDIAIEREKKAPKKAEPKKQDPLKFDAGKRLRDQLAQEQQSLAQKQERDEAIRQFAPAVQSSPVIDAGYADRIRSRIKQYIVVPPDMKGNPEAIFDVVQLPSGDVMSARLRQSSGVRAYDEAVERAILKASPLPKPDRPEQFRRDLQLKFRPQE